MNVIFIINHEVVIITVMVAGHFIRYMCMQIAKYAFCIVLVTYFTMMFADRHYENQGKYRGYRYINLNDLFSICPRPFAFFFFTKFITVNRRITCKVCFKFG